MKYKFFQQTKNSQIMKGIIYVEIEVIHQKLNSKFLKYIKLNDEIKIKQKN